jgi:hypothetical protein
VVITSVPPARFTAASARLAVFAARISAWLHVLLMVAQTALQLLPVLAAQVQQTALAQPAGQIHQSAQ